MTPWNLCRWLLAIALLSTGCDEDPFGAYEPYAAPSPPITAPAGSVAMPQAATWPSLCDGRTTRPGPAPLRRLTSTEYDNTVRDLFGDTTSPASAFPNEQGTVGFDNSASGQSVSNLHIERYMEAAEQLVWDILNTRPEVVFVRCDDPLNAVPLQCADWTLEDFATLAFRRPITDEEQARYLAFFRRLYEDEGEDFNDALGMVMEVILQSPHFLYRLEFGQPDDDGDGIVALTQSELAVRMAYLVWASAPDQALIAWASTPGNLDEPIEVKHEMIRMLNDPKAHRTVNHFHRQWLQIASLPTTFKDEGLFPEFDPALKQQMVTETDTFIEQVVFSGAGDLKTLLTADFSYMTPTLAAFYGLDPTQLQATDSVPDGTKPPVIHGYSRVQLDTTKRRGLLTHASVMASHAKPDQTSPVVRGKFVREQLLCDILQPPPADVNDTPPALDPNLSTRDRFAAHSDIPRCRGCHIKMDDLGFTFEHYDAIGRYRETESDGGVAINAASPIRFTDVNGEVDNALGLVDKLSGSRQLQDCYVNQWFRFAHGRTETEADTCSLDYLYDAFDAGKLDIPTLIIELALTDAFRFRPVVVPDSLVEVTP